MAANRMLKYLVYAIIVLSLSNAGIGFCCYYNAVQVDIVLEQASHFHFLLFLYIVASLIPAVYAVLWLVTSQPPKQPR